MGIGINRSCGSVNVDRYSTECEGSQGAAEPIITQQKTAAQATQDLVAFMARSNFNTGYFGQDVDLIVKFLRANVAPANWFHAVSAVRGKASSELNAVGVKLMDGAARTLGIPIQG